MFPEASVSAAAITDKKSTINLCSLPHRVRSMDERIALLLMN